MRIVQIITRSDTIGGAHVQVAAISNWLQEHDNQVTVLVGGKGPFTEVLNDLHVPLQSVGSLVRPISFFLDVRCIHELRTILRALGPDVVATHSAKAGMMGRLAARRLKIPVVHTAHGWSYLRESSLLKRIFFLQIERYLAPLTDCIVTVCKEDYKFALEKRIGSRRNLHVIHNGIDDVPQRLYAKPEKEPVRLVTIARLDWPKDYHTLFKALSELKDLDWFLDIVGDGPQKLHYEKMSQRMGIRHRLTFHGLRRDVPEILSKAQIMLLMSRWEGLPVSILEAMRAYLPVIASHVGGIPELVKHGRSGFLVKAGDSSELSHSLRLLIEDSSLRRKMGEVGRDKFEQDFTSERMMLSLFREYMIAANGRHG